MARPNRRKVWVQVDPDTWQAYRVKCFAANVQVQDSLGSFATAVAQGLTPPRSQQLELGAANDDTTVGLSYRRASTAPRTRRSRVSGVVKDARAAKAAKPAARTSKKAPPKRGRTGRS